MRLPVDYQGACHELVAEPGKVVGAWSGPPDAPVGGLPDRLRDLFESPTAYPALRRIVVPGDRVAIPFDPSLPGGVEVLRVMAEVLAGAGVESVTAVVDGRAFPTANPGVDGVQVAIHDPGDRDSLAYLASTVSGRRVYLNRLLADADCVIPVGRLGFGPSGAVLGPWSVIQPGLADAGPSPVSLQVDLDEDSDADEAAEVSWLLGAQFQVAGVPGRTGLLDVFAGEATAVRAEGGAALSGRWRFEADDRADLVVAGVGGPGRVVAAPEFAAAVRTALRLVRRGGKVALLTGLGTDAVVDALVGPALPRDDWKRALAWADLYLLSDADADAVEELGFVPLDAPDQAARLARVADSVTAVGQADRTLAVVRA